MIIGCSKEEDIDLKMSINYILKHPSYIPKPIEKISLNSHKVSLGKQLFFDKNLSSNKKVSCATCHNPKLAFADDTPLSPKGVSNSLLERHSPALFNLAWQNDFFWDGGAPNLRSQVIAPLIASNEMNSKITDILSYLNSKNSYKEQFNTIYKSPPKIAYILDAIAEYEFSITSFNSKYDATKRGEIQLTKIEKHGYQLYKINCASCHTEGLFSDYQYRNNGLDETITSFSGLEDVKRGRNRITHLEKDIQKYKTPSLRNLSLTPPYMHDGRYDNLEEVLNHYSHKIKNSKTLSTKIPSQGFSFTKLEKLSLITFLKTLNDVESFEK